MLSLPTDTLTLWSISVETPEAKLGQGVQRGPSFGFPRRICGPASWLAVWGRSGASVVTGLSDLGPPGAQLLTVGKKASEARIFCLRLLKPEFLFLGLIFGFS